jgi:hypothetical protein
MYNRFSHKYTKTGNLVLKTQIRQNNLKTFELKTRQNFVKKLQKMTGTGMSNISKIRH